MNPTWPSVEEQLAASNVIPGSELEKLVRENQDFELLGPDEVSDNSILPLWLRVYWRQHHPEDPPGVYPKALHNIHTWMVSHQDLPGPSSNEPEKQNE